MCVCVLVGVGGGGECSNESNEHFLKVKLIELKWKRKSALNCGAGKRLRVQYVTIPSKEK